MSAVETLFDLLTARAEQAPQRLALIDGEAGLSYAGLHAAALGMANGLRDSGVKKGDRVLLLVPLGLRFFIVFLALTRLGAAVILVDPAMAMKTLRACLRNVRPDVLIGVPKAHLFRLIPEVRAIPLALSVDGYAPFARQVIPRDGPFSGAAKADDAALITFTSGSTGIPKTIVRSHGFLLNQHQAVQATLDPQAGDIELSTLPVFILSNIGCGITSVIPLKGYARPHTMPAGKMIAYMQAKGVNRLLAAPAFCRALCDEAKRHNTALRGLKRIFTGGGPVFPNLMRDIAEVAPEAALIMVFGSSEAEPIAHIDAHAVSGADLKATALGAGLLAGHPVEVVRIAIIADLEHGLETIAADVFETMKQASGVTGEIVVSGAHVVKGYLDAADNAGTKFRVGDEIWHRTGDAGYFDGEGRLWLMGRCSARLTTTQGITYPFAIEAAAMSIGGVRRAAVVQVKGEAILALEADHTLQGHTLTEIRLRFPQIDDVRHLKHIPVDRRHHSKVLYADLKKHLETS